MIKKINIASLLIALFFLTKGHAQGTFPIYTDYLSDNILLVHPSVAGLSVDYGKLRVSHRQQWTNNEDSPSLQTLSYHQRLGLNAGIGAVVFNDQNGFHSQFGIQAAYAYHLNFGRVDALDQISFGIAASYVQNSVDQRSFVRPDPIISRVVESNNYFNADFSAAYFNLDGYAFLTVKNLLLNTKNDADNAFKSVNLRRYLLNVGYFFGWEKRFQFEPSFMLQYVEKTSEFSADINAKVYTLLGRNKRVWMALSYRQSFDDNPISELSQISSILGFEINKYSVSYSYAQQLGKFTFENGGFHQLTLGINLSGRLPKSRGYFPKFNPFMFRNDN